MAERPKGISPETAEAYALLGIPYEGYVEGIGYQSLLAQTMGSCYFQERGCAIPQFEAVMDSSPEMRIQSVGYKHKVKAGETLTSISQHYGITIASIMAANPGIDWPKDRNNGDLIFAGETLALPNLGTLDLIENEASPKVSKLSKALLEYERSQLIAVTDAIKVNTRYSIAVGGGEMFDLVEFISTANTIIDEVYSTKFTKGLGWGMSGGAALKQLSDGQYPEALWTIIDEACGIYSLGAKTFYQMSQSEYVQTEIGRMAYRDYMHNINMYRRTGRDIYFQRADKAYRKMRSAQKTIQIRK